MEKVGFKVDNYKLTEIESVQFWLLYKVFYCGSQIVGEKH